MNNYFLNNKNYLKSPIYDHIVLVYSTFCRLTIIALLFDFLNFLPNMLQIYSWSINKIHRYLFLFSKNHIFIALCENHLIISIMWKKMLAWIERDEDIWGKQSFVRTDWYYPLTSYSYTAFSDKLSFSRTAFVSSYVPRNQIFFSSSLFLLLFLSYKHPN